MRYQRAQTYETTLAAHRSMQHQFRSLRLRFDAEKHCDVLFPPPPQFNYIHCPEVISLR